MKRLKMSSETKDEVSTTSTNNNEYPYSEHQILRQTEEVIEFVANMPKPIQMMIGQFQRTNRVYPSTVKYIQCYYKPKDKLLTAIFNFKRNGSLPAEAFDNTKYLELIGIQFVKPFTEHTQIHLTYFYKE